MQFRLEVLDPNWQFGSGTRKLRLGLTAVYLTGHGQRHARRPLNDATGFYLLRLSEVVAQRKDRRQKYHERQKNLTESTCRCCDGLLCQRGWCCAHLVSARGRRGRRPIICFLAFLRSGEGQRAAQLPAGSFDTGEGQRVASTSRGSRCRFIKMVNHARP